MYLITGLHKETLKMVDVAIASCWAELQAILDQESLNYYGLRWRKLKIG